ncbi:elongation factor Ts, mitochondrial [Falco rusticolus]|uniref:elongation factor Ts, mitochondrial n=1 Tax=Falco rusticolus TaxID=120794 RepID=UPI001886A04D|nr:elongation factor Ts, mitochondrial [Falco rusticolus]
MQRAARGALRAAAWAPPARLLHAASPVLAADRAALLALRRSTGLPFLQCREALERCGGDLPQAEAWLQEEAQRRGWIRATELQSRRAPQGLVGLVRQGPLAAMVEVNCETDFVARNGEFQQVVEQAVLSTVALCRTAPPGAGNKHLLAVEELAQLRTEPGGALLSDRIAVATGKLGEKVALRRAAWLRVPEPGGHIAAYAHGWLPASGPLAMGTYGALVACQVPEPWVGVGTVEEVGRKVAQHVVGMAPSTLGTPQDEPQGEGETRLLAQSFLLEPGVTVGQFLGEGGGLVVTDFLRFHCGEEETPAPPA